LLKRLLQSSRKVVFKRSWPTKIEKFFIFNSWRLQKKIKSCKNHNLLTLDPAGPCYFQGLQYTVQGFGKAY
jgi:hypothetical protein